MNFKQYYITESIIDIPRKDYSRSIFDDYNTKNPKLKPSIKKIIEDQIKEFEKFAPVIKYRLIGSILTKRYRKDADLDVNIFFDVPTEEQEIKLKELRAELKKVNGRFVPGTEHPINYFTIVDGDIYKKANEMADDVYDIVNQQFEKRTKQTPFNLDDYMEEFKTKVQKIDLVKGKLKRDLIDYEELKELDMDDLENLSVKIKEKVKELEEDINTLIAIKAGITFDRQFAFKKKEMEPEEIREYGARNRLPENVVYKMLEKYYYWNFIKKLDEIIGDDNELSDKEAEELAKI